MNTVLLKCFLFAALVINTDQHKLIDIQESPLLQAELQLEQSQDQEQITIPITPRRHSIQEDKISSNFFEQQFAQHMQSFENDESEWDVSGETSLQKDSRRFHANALNWLRHFNLMRDKCQYDTISQRRFKTVLRKTSSENELLLMSPTNGLSLGELPAIRRSFSSGLLFAI